MRPQVRRVGRTERLSGRGGHQAFAGAPLRASKPLRFSPAAYESSTPVVPSIGGESQLGELRTLRRLVHASPGWRHHPEMAHVGQDMTPPEIGRVLRIRPGSIRSRLSGPFPHSRPKREETA